MFIFDALMIFTRRLSQAVLIPIFRFNTLRQLRQYRPLTLSKMQTALSLGRGLAERVFHESITSEIKFRLDYSWIAKAKPKQLQKEIEKVQIHNREILQALLETNRPILILSIHMGSFYFGFLKLAMSVHGRRAISVVKLASQTKREDALHALFEHKLGRITTLRFDEDVGKKAYLALRKGGIVVMMSDIEVKVTSRELVSFLGAQCYMQSGPAVLALTTRAVILPVINFEDSQGTRIIRLEEPLYPDAIVPGESSREIVSRLMGRIAGLMESWIRIAPAQFQRWTDVALTLSRDAVSGDKLQEIVNTGLMKKMRAQDLPALANRFRDHKHSYFLLSSVHGFSMSELQVSIDDPAVFQYLDATGEECTLVSFMSIDRLQGVAQIQICGECRQPFGIQNQIRKFRENTGVRRLYSYVFPWEVQEIQNLKSLGFQHEAVFREHIYIDGKYRDIWVFGVVEGDA